ncbi:uncharacterized [Tachysurus ichikawai]
MGQLEMIKMEKRRRRKEKCRLCKKNGDLVVYLEEEALKKQRNVEGRVSQHVSRPVQGQMEEQAGRKSE